MLRSRSAGAQVRYGTGAICLVALLALNGCAGLASSAPGSSQTTSASGSAWTPGAAARSTAQAAGQRTTTMVMDVRYGFSFPIPSGWHANGADGMPLGRSAHIQLVGPNVSQGGGLITISVCHGGGVCPPGPTRPIARTTKEPTVLAGAPGTLFTWHFATESAAASTAEVHTVADHAGYTYDIAGWVPARESMPAAYTALLRGWQWHTLPPAPSGVQVDSIHMEGGGGGWAVAKSPQGLLHTTDGGTRWSDITPLAKGVTWDATACATDFLDAEHAWVACPDAKPAQEVPWGFTVWRTTDGGSTWTAVPVMSAYSPADTIGSIRALSLDFADAQHGWLVIQPSHTMNSSPGELLTTTDGGVSWSEIGHAKAPGQATLPVGGEVSFTGADDGWLVGQKVSTGISSLYRTKDGGRSWQPVALSVPSALQQHYIGPQASPELPVFGLTHPRWGVLTAVVQDVHGIVVQEALYTTTDGGVNWTWLHSPPARQWSVADFVTGQVGFLWVPQSHDFNSLSPVQGKLYRTEDGGKTWTDAGVLGNVVQLDFTSAEQGWAITASRDTGARAVMATQDGGHTWSRISVAPTAAR